MTIDAGNNDYRIFKIDDLEFFAGIDVLLSDLTLTGGNATGTGDDAHGGAILNREIVKVLRSTISGNTAGIGGGIYNSNSAVAILTNSTLSGNSANQEGGGIYNASTATITNSTVSGNSANDKGGGLFNVGTATINNSTLSGNSATDGGGIYNLDFFFRPPIVTLSSTIVANSVSGGDLSGGATFSGDNNLIEDGSGSGLVATIAGDPKLDPLADNGGPTLTHVLQSDSPAIDMGFSTESLDQRGEPFLRSVGGGVDIGAVELQSIDFGDAPSRYLGEASHQAVGPRLGDQRDSDLRTTVSEFADGDDATGIDDEDGVLFGAAIPGLSAGINIDVQGTTENAFVEAWIDFDHSGAWEPGEQILSGPVTPGLKTLNYPVPSNATPGVTFARVRVSMAGNLGPGGAAPDGEVEDYAVTIGTRATIPTATINPGSVTRSEITSIEVMFSESVPVVASDFVLQDAVTLAVIPVGIQVMQVGNVATLTFTDGPRVVPSIHPEIKPTLADGGYRLLYRPTVPLTDDGLINIDNFFRKYGDTDVTSSPLVGLSDFAAFRASFGLDVDDAGFNSGLDANRDGNIGLTDFAAFRSAFGN